VRVILCQNQNRKLVFISGWWWQFTPGAIFQPPDFTLSSAPDMLPESYQVVPAISRFIAFSPF